MSRASSAGMGEVGAAELERERSIGEPIGEDKEGEVGAGVESVERGEASWAAASGVGEPAGGASATRSSGRRERRASGAG